MKEQTKHTPPDKIATMIMNALQKELGDNFCPDCLRMGLGLALSSTHSVMLAAAGDNKEAQDEAVGCAVDSIHRLLGSLKGTINSLKIGNFDFTIASVPIPEKKTHESNLNLH